MLASNNPVTNSPIQQISMSSNILPLSDDSDKPSNLMHLDDGATRGAGHSLQHFQTFNEAGGRGRESGSVGETRRIPRRTSQLPQKATSRQSSIRNLSSKETDRLSVLSPEGTKDSLRGASAELIVEKNGVMPKQRVRESSSRRDTRTILPPMKPARSLSRHRHGFDGAHTKIGTPKLASNRSDSRPDAPATLKSRPHSLIEPLEIEFEPKSVADQENQGASGNTSPASNTPGAGLVTAKFHYHGLDGISGHVRPRSEFNPALTEASQRHSRSRTQQLLDVTTLPSAEVATRKTSTTHPQRPPFSTLQRHFSPKKSLKGAIAPVHAQPTTKHGGSHELSSENVRIQTELTQLHILLHPAVEVQKQWERSAKKRLQSHFGHLRGRHIQLKEHAQSHQATVNRSALVAWCDDLPSLKVAEKLQLLSHSIQEISALIESEGRYTRILNSFELWFARACRIRDLRDRPSDSTGQGLEFIESIGDDWKIEIAGLEMKLSSCSRELRNLGKLQGSSTLAHFLLSFQRAVTNFLDELSIIRAIESDLMTQEISEIEAMIALSVTADDSNMSSIPASYQGIWHSGD